mgnify:CR=1 FL=1
MKELENQDFLKLEKMDFPFAEFKEFFEKVNYNENHAKYSKQYCRSLTRKAIEHFISFKILDPQSSNSFYIDVAASSSPASKIAKNVYGVEKSFRQDLNYADAEVEKGDVIISNATDIPVESDSVDMITLHNSWEHFESNDDFDFVGESTRILKKGGKVCITPLELSNTTEILTSPMIWYTKFRRLNDTPMFDKNAEIFINEKKMQRQEKTYSVDYLATRLKEYSDKMKFTVYYLADLEDDCEVVTRELGDKNIYPGVLNHLSRYILIGEKL